MGGWGEPRGPDTRTADAVPDVGGRDVGAPHPATDWSRHAEVSAETVARLRAELACAQEANARITGELIKLRQEWHRTRDKLASVYLAWAELGEKLT